MITSTSNDQVKMIRKLRDRKYRSETGHFYAEGIRIIQEAFNQHAEIQKVVFSPGLVRNDGALELISNLRDQGIETLEVSDVVFNSLSLKDNPQGIAAVISQKWSEPEIIFENFSGLWLGLFEVADPGNLGTILRTMDAVGGRGIFLIDNCTDPYDPSSMRASMGAIFSQKIARVTKKQLIEYVNNNNLSMTGAADSARLDFHQQEYVRDMILLMGSEREGLPEDLKSVCQSMVSIPMLGSGDSLNLAVATGIILYEILNQLKS